MTEPLAFAVLVVAGAVLILLVIPPATPLTALAASAVCVGLGWLGAR